MNPERWQQVDELFKAAVELDRSRRTAFLDECCSDDKTLRREVESLLESDERAWDLIEKPALEVAAPLLSDDHPQLTSGQHIGRYQIISLIGRGGMGEVYLAKDEKLNRSIALKLLPADYTRDKNPLRRFQQEAQAASALNHPNILTIHELGEVDGQGYIATEFVEGDTLRARLKGAPMNMPDVLDIAIQMAGALAAAHQAGIVHRDIKPENIMLRRDGYVKVLDFGLAKLTEQHEQTPADGSVENPGQSSGLLLGTLKYMSPEQAQGLGVDARSDIFSLGVVLYEMLAGRAAFDGSTTSDLIAAILQEEPAQPPNAPDELVRIVRKALRKNRDERYQTVGELVTDLKRFKETWVIKSTFNGSDRGTFERETDTSNGTPSAPSAERLISEIKQRRLRAGLSLGVILIFIIAVGVGMYTLSRQSSTGAPFKNLNATPVTNIGDGWAPSISPDGKYVVYARNALPGDNPNMGDPAVFSLWLREVGSASEVQIVPPTPGRCYSTAFSPDGEHIYYGVGAGQPVRIFVVPTAGGRSTQLPLRRAFPVSISPDGKSLVYLDSNPTEGKTSVVIANSDGTDAREIVTRPEANYFRRTVKPSWSPDGKLIACIGQDRGQSFPHVFEVNIEERTERPITSQKWTDMRGVVWLPDMSGLLLVAAEETSSIPQIWRISYPDGAAHRITNDGVNYSGLDFTANGTALVTTRSEILTSIWVTPVEQADSTADLTVDTSKARLISSANLTNRDDLNNVYERLSWTPDGRIVYMSKESGNADIWSMNADGSDHRQLTTDRHSDSDSTVSPDGRYIAFVSNRAGAENIWIMDISGENQRRLTSQFIERSPDFSADSKWVFYNSWETGKATIWKIPVEGGVPVPVLPYTSFFPSVSPDGNLLAYIGDNTTGAGLEEILVALSGGGPPMKSFPGNYLLNWTPDGKGLTYPWNGPIAGQSSRQVFNLWEQPLDGGKPQQLTKFPEPIFVHAWSRDGKRLAVLTARYTSDVVLMSKLE